MLKPDAAVKEKIHFDDIIHSLMSFLQRIKSVERKFDFRSLTMFLIIDLFISSSLAATRVLIENTRRASETDKVTSAESFLPVNGNITVGINKGFKYH